MKIKANKVEKGMTIGWSDLTVNVDKVEESFQKNGKQLINITGSMEKSMGRNKKPIKFYSTISPKGETLLNLK